MATHWKGLSSCSVFNITSVFLGLSIRSQGNHLEVEESMLSCSALTSAVPHHAVRHRPPHQLPTFNNSAPDLDNLDDVSTQFRRMISIWLEASNFDRSCVSPLCLLVSLIVQLLQYIGHTSPECLESLDMPRNMPSKHPPPPLTSELEEEVMTRVVSQRYSEKEYLARMHNQSLWVSPTCWNAYSHKRRTIKKSRGRIIAFLIARLELDASCSSLLAAKLLACAGLVPQRQSYGYLPGSCE